MDKSIDKNSATLSNNFVVILATAILKLPPTFIQTYRQERQHDDGDDGDGDSGHQSGIVLHHSRLDDGSVSSVPHGRYLVYEKRKRKNKDKRRLLNGSCCIPDRAVLPSVVLSGWCAVDVDRCWLGYYS